MTAIALSASDARALTDQIKTGVEAIWELIKTAYTGRAWEQLGYASWDDYCTREFGTSRIRLPREERQEVVASMREIGMSTRAIASATGMSKDTAARALSGVANETPGPVTGTDGKEYPASQPPRPAPEPEPEPAPVTFTCWSCEHDYPTDQATEVPEGPICGDCLDTYDTPPEPEYPDGRPVGFEPGDLDALNVPAPNPGPAKPKRRPITDQARDAGWELRKAVERLERIAEDDRFAANASKVAPHMRSHLTNAIEVCQDLLDRINTHQGV